MEVRELTPEVILTTDIIEGTDGTGEKMSKSKGNYIALVESAEEMYGKVMSIPDRLIAPYLRTLTEIDEKELTLLTQRIDAGSINPMIAKHLLAYDVVSALHGTDSAQRAREQFTAQFSKRSLRDITDIPSVQLPQQGTSLVVDVLLSLRFVDSKSDARRTADAGGVQLVAEGETTDTIKLTSDQVLKETLASVMDTIRVGKDPATAYFLKLGRSVARIA
jgi:tyrosyl-tRNA synthetase